MPSSWRQLGFSAFLFGNRTSTFLQERIFFTRLRGAPTSPRESFLPFQFREQAYAVRSAFPSAPEMCRSAWELRTSASADYTRMPPRVDPWCSDLRWAAWQFLVRKVRG